MTGVGSSDLRDTTQAHHFAGLGKQAALSGTLTGSSNTSAPARRSVLRYVVLMVAAAQSRDLCVKTNLPALQPSLPSLTFGSSPGSRRARAVALGFST